MHLVVLINTSVLNQLKVTLCCNCLVAVLVNTLFKITKMSEYLIVDKHKYIAQSSFDFVKCVEVLVNAFLQNSVLLHL